MKAKRISIIKHEFEDDCWCLFVDDKRIGYFDTWQVAQDCAKQLTHPLFPLKRFLRRISTSYYTFITEWKSYK